MLCVGELLNEQVIAACRQVNIGIISSPRAHELLRHFRAKAVICLAADPKTVMALAANRTPVIVIATATPDWSISGVTVIGGDTPPATLAALIREVASGRSAGAAFAAA